MFWLWCNSCVIRSILQNFIKLIFVANTYEGGSVPKKIISINVCKIFSLHTKNVVCFLHVFFNTYPGQLIGMPIFNCNQGVLKLAHIIPWANWANWLLARLKFELNESFLFFHHNEFFMFYRAHSHRMRFWFLFSIQESKCLWEFHHIISKQPVRKNFWYQIVCITCQLNLHSPVRIIFSLLKLFMLVSLFVLIQMGNHFFRWYICNSCQIAQAWHVATAHHNPRIWS